MSPFMQRLFPSCVAWPCYSTSCEIFERHPSVAVSDYHFLPSVQRVSLLLSSRLSYHFARTVLHEEHWLVGRGGSSRRHLTAGSTAVLRLSGRARGAISAGLEAPALRQARMPAATGMVRPSQFGACFRAAAATNSRLADDCTLPSPPPPPAT